MTLTEKRGNVFEYAKTHHLAHCIASDLRMGAGIAVAFQKKFHLRGALQNLGVSLEAPTCVLLGGVFNLITKKRSGGKPSYRSMRGALECMARIVGEKRTPWIAMPRIGCGLDRLVWPKVKEIVKETFGELDVEIVVCRL